MEGEPECRDGKRETSKPLAAVGTNLTRSATLSGFESLATSLGLNAVELLQAANVPVAALSNPDILLSIDAVASVLEAAARQSRQQAFGLLLAETRRLSNLGMLGMLLREEPTLRCAVHALARFQGLQNAGLLLKLEEDGQFARIHLDLRLRRPGAGRQGIEMAAAITLRTLRSLSHGEFRAEWISFVHERPASLDVHRRVLGVPVEFGQGANAIVCRVRDLDLTLPAADPVFSRAIRTLLEQQLPAGKDDPLEPVRQVVKSLLPGGQCSVDRVAELLGTHRRTLNRRLGSLGQNISSVINDVRAELAESYLGGHQRPLYEVASLLGFASSADFCRWFRGRFGMTASQWAAMTMASAPSGGDPDMYLSTDADTSAVPDAATVCSPSVARSRSNAHGVWMRVEGTLPSLPRPEDFAQGGRRPDAERTRQ